VTEAARALLELRGVSAGYGETVVLRDVSVNVPAGSVVALLGANGAGKTTTLRVAAGLVRPTEGSVLIAGEDVTATSPNKRASAGLCLIPEGRGVFRGLTVAENLRMLQPAWVKGEDRAEAALEAFPILKERMSQVARSMSGGEQQMLALARCWLADPKVVLLDEVSMGLAPVIVDQIFEALRLLAARGVALLLVEQYVHRAMGLADHVVLLNQGRVTFSGPAAEVDESDLMRTYLGVDNAPVDAG
jgi:branched-chain amino acid transport system ATP-binding protein